MKLWDLSGYSEKSNIQEAYLSKTSFSAQIVSEISAQLCSDDSIQILLNLTWVQTFRPKSNMRLLAVNNKSNKTKSEKIILYFSYIRLQKQHSSLMYWLKICKAWVRSQLGWAWNWLKLIVTSSNVLRIINHWLSARSDVGLTQGSLIPEERSLYRKHSIRQHKLDLNLSKTNQPLSKITNSHLNHRYLTASANL